MRISEKRLCLQVENVSEGFWGLCAFRDKEIGECLSLQQEGLFIHGGGAEMLMNGNIC